MAKKAKEVVAPVVDKAKDVSATVVDAMSNTRAGNGARVAYDAAAKAAGWVLGTTSKMFESCSGGAGTVSTGKGDKGGASYGTYQLASKTGTLAEFVNQSSHKNELNGLKAGTPEFNAKWKEIAKSDSNFEAEQHDFIKKTHYDPAVKGLSKSGIDLSGRCSAVQDSLWSTSVQFGAGGVKSKRGAVPLIMEALKGKDVSKMSDADIVSAIQDYKIANNDKLFQSSDEENKKGTLNRAIAEKKSLVSRAGISANGIPAVASTSTAIPIAPTLPPMPIQTKVPDAPMQQPLTQLQKSEKPIDVNVKIDSGDVRQDLSDRGIAHIATGGMSGGFKG